MFDDQFPITPDVNNLKNGLDDDRLFFLDYERFIEDNLDLEELLLSKMLTEGYTIIEIAKQMGTCRKTITRRLKGLRYKIRSFLDDYFQS